ncbi:MAG: hypothetical protein K6C94_10220 [Candidatus Gastranaerophilales bacterium]|nr:hypothetical protein [Candidatus Gastranaerophilales bacterium]
MIKEIITNLHNKYDSLVNNSIYKGIISAAFSLLLFCICAFAIYLRYKVYSANLSMFCDEVSVLINLSSKSYSQLFLPLFEAQCTPPLFLVLYKFIYGLTGFNDTLLKLPIFLFSILNVLLFCYLTFSALKNRCSVIFANIVFALSQPVIYYCWILKQYQTDITCTILILIVAYKIKNENISLKQIMFLSIITAIFMLFSYTSVFIIGTTIITLFLYKFFKKTLPDDFIKKFLIYAAIPFITAIIFFVVNCLPTLQNNVLQTYWDNNWFNMFFFPQTTVDWANLIPFFTSGGLNISNYIAICVILIISLLLMLLKDKFSLSLLSLPFITAALLGYFHLYPFCPERVCLYLIPVGILIIAKLIDNADFKKVKLSFPVFLIIICSFYNYRTIDYIIDDIINFKDKFFAYGGIMRTNSRDFAAFLNQSDISYKDYVVTDSFWAAHNVIKMYDKNNKINHDNIIDSSNADSNIEQLDALDKNSRIYFYISSKFSYFGWNIYLSDWIEQNCKIDSTYEVNGGNVIKCIKK